MRNIETSVSGNILTLKIDLAADKSESSSGKSLIIASTEGNVSIDEANMRVIRHLDIPLQKLNGTREKRLKAPWSRKKKKNLKKPKPS